MGVLKEAKKVRIIVILAKKAPDYAYGLLTYIRGPFFDTNGTLAATANIPMGPTCPVLNALLYVSDSLVV